MKARIHPEQTARLAALRRLDILDTPREEEFDEVVRLASRVCGAPIAVINLIDADRQWFKAEVGLGVRETPLDTSICSHVILEKDFVEIADTRADPRMQDNPLCLSEPGLRFYAGALLKTEENGLPIGTLCVLDYEPRKLTALQVETIRVLAHQVMRQLELRYALRRQDVLRREIDHRVKNSLQTVSSLVSMQRMRSGSDETRDALAAVHNRIHAISLLHKELHEASVSDVVDMPRFMASIALLVRSSAPANVLMDIDFDEVELPSNQASALAMIVNEFVANSLKHAFPGARPGRVSVRGRRLDDNTLEVVCEDDGVGAQSKADGPRSQGLGLRIIEASATQLGATLERRSTGAGFGLKLTFLLRRQA